MIRPSAGQLDRARRLLASEAGSSGSSDGTASAAGRVYEKVDAQLAQLLGRAGVRALFARSAKAAQTELASLADAVGDSATLSARLQSFEPSVASESAVALFGTLLELITTFIGERLTVQVLRRAWPAIEEMAPRETQK
jgi:hypothetical protein